MYTLFSVIMFQLTLKCYAVNVHTTTYTWCIKANQLCWKDEKVCISNDNYITEINKPGKELLPATQITGLVLARGGSKMIPRKNLAKIGNQTLLEMSLQVMNNFGIWVSTDDVEIATVAQRSGASVHRRSAETATDTAPSIVGVQEFCVNHPDSEKGEGEEQGWVTCEGRRVTKHMFMKLQE
uniref:Uncharacterized protein n=1 Tax=Timema cristinae TaxID=61476 RepID=A0A7R9GV41_TIMCR|nr:unnamed protein product [Timema cristinae]